MADDKYFMMRSLEKAISVIETMATNSNWKLKTLSEACSIPKGTLQRILRTLEELGYVRQLERGGAYTLTLKLHKIGKQIASQNSLGSILKPILAKLRDKVNETVNLSVLSNLNMVLVHQEISGHALQMDSVIGDSFSAYLSASGKVFLAFLPEDDLHLFMEKLRASDSSITTDRVEQTLKELETVRKTGVGFDFEEIYKGVRCVAAPVFDDSGKIIATISCSVPTVRLDRYFSQKLLYEIPMAAVEASKLFQAPDRSFYFDIDNAVDQLVGTI
ncbi:IclR family transcriptional regulator [Halodesulfovibrio marinisediminis]|uniref:Transcriptional regulator, IclR family n=1 Tax=Halodesulfovibrio marinisediminis DSM 17456 TaxID=1121457 RepID=A0A1N6EDC9_9BACT|nr:IclR family transcriptional regulator [Halodesulfovibrio marinisediminis]SIN81052.1 transcriptional regulator, IclR family [Halodesulfovibrio marinisediminis DSM 17456]